MVVSNQNVFSSLIVTGVVALSLAMFLGAGSARAQSSSANYTFLLASGFLCDPGDTATCPAVVKSANGDSYELSGAGTLTTQSKSVTAAGTFTHKSSTGNVLETGVWVASELVSFDSYGIAPGALMRGGRAFGPPQFGPMRLRMSSGSMPAGGLAVFRIRLLPVWGLSKNAMLQVNCALGKVPDESPTEGIKLALEGGGAKFDEQASGRTMFLLTRQGANPAPKPPPAEAEPNPASADPQP
jgi:hypothetical protein